MLAAGRGRGGGGGVGGAGVARTEEGRVKAVNVNEYLRCDTQQSEVVGWRVYAMWPGMRSAQHVMCALKDDQSKRRPAAQEKNCNASEEEPLFSEFQDAEHIFVLETKPVCPLSDLNFCIVFPF